jgi:hypothetical protein
MLKKKIKIWLSSDVTQDVNDSVNDIRRAFNDELLEWLASVDSESHLARIAIVPKVLDPRLGVVPDSRHYDNATETEYVSTNISHPLWMEGSWSERVDLYALAIRRAIEGTSERRLLQSDRQRILQIVEKVRVKLRELHSRPE